MGALDTVQMPFSLRAWPTAPQISGAVPQMNPPVANIVATQVPSILAAGKDPIAEIGSGLLSAVSAFSPQEKEKRALEKLKLNLETQKSRSDIQKLDLENRLLESMMGSKVKAQDIANATAELDNNLKQMQLQKAQWESGNWGSDAALSAEEKVAKINDLNSQISQRQQQQQMVSGALSSIGRSSETPTSENMKVLAQLPGGKTLTQVTYDETEPVEMTVGGMKVPVGSRTIKKTKIMETGDGEKILTDTATDKLNKFEQGLQDIQLLQQDYAKLVEKGKAGYLKGRASGALGWFGGGDPDIRAYQNRLTSVVPGLARGVFGEVGVLTDKDVERYTKVLSDPITNPEIASKNFQQLIDKMQRGYEGAVKTYEKAGYNVKGFDPEALKMLKEETSETKGPPEISTKAAYDALSTGQKFIWVRPDGTKIERVKE